MSGTYVAAAASSTLQFALVNEKGLWLAAFGDGDCRAVFTPMLLNDIRARLLSRSAEPSLTPKKSPDLAHEKAWPRRARKSDVVCVPVKINHLVELVNFVSIKFQHHW